MHLKDRSTRPGAPACEMTAFGIAEEHGPTVGPSPVVAPAPHHDGDPDPSTSANYWATVVTESLGELL